MRHRRLPVLAAGALAAALAGCGSPTYHGEAGRVDTAIRAYDHADRSRDRHELCARELTAHYRKAISGTVEQCATLLGHTRGPHGLSRWTHLEVHGRSATAHITTRDESKGTMRLVERRGRWLVDGIDFTSLGD
jgi:hypothetical protein